jgi:hypothetical protein
VEFPFAEFALSDGEALPTGLPFGVVSEESDDVGLEPKPLPLEGEDSTAPLDVSTALGADWTGLLSPPPLLPSEP